MRQKTPSRQSSPAPQTVSMPPRAAQDSEPTRSPQEEEMIDSFIEYATMMNLEHFSTLGEILKSQSGSASGPASCSNNDVSSVAEGLGSSRSPSVEHQGLVATASSGSLTRVVSVEQLQRSLRDATYNRLTVCRYNMDWAICSAKAEHLERELQVRQASLRSAMERVSFLEQAIGNMSYNMAASEELYSSVMAKNTEMENIVNERDTQIAMLEHKIAALRVAVSTPRGSLNRAIPGGRGSGTSPPPPSLYSQSAGAGSPVVPAAGVLPQDPTHQGVTFTDTSPQTVQLVDQPPVAGGGGGPAEQPNVSLGGGNVSSPVVGEPTPTTANIPPAATSGKAGGGAVPSTYGRVGVKSGGLRKIQAHKTPPPPVQQQQAASGAGGIGGGAADQQESNESTEGAVAYVAAPSPSNSASATTSRPVGLPLGAINRIGPPVAQHNNHQQQQQPDDGNWSRTLLNSVTATMRLVDALVEQRLTKQTRAEGPSPHLLLPVHASVSSADVSESSFSASVASPSPLMYPLSASDQQQRIKSDTSVLPSTERCWRCELLERDLRQLREESRATVQALRARFDEQLEKARREFVFRAVQQGMSAMAEIQSGAGNETPTQLDATRRSSPYCTDVTSPTVGIEGRGPASPV